MAGLAAGQSTSALAKALVGAVRTASSTTVKGAVVGGSARPSASAIPLAGRWGADVGVGGGCREKNPSRAARYLKGSKR